MKTKSYKGIYSGIKPNEMGYFSRIKSQRKWRKKNCDGQLSQRGHGKIPLEKIRYRDPEKYRLPRIVDTLRNHLGYGKNIWNFRKIRYIRNIIKEDL